MSDDKDTEKPGEKKPDADGRDCPAAYPLCVCGVRGCQDYRKHTPKVTRVRRWRR
jgi:hypothetical protein